MAFDLIVLDSHGFDHEYFTRSSARYLRDIGGNIQILRVEEELNFFLYDTSKALFVRPANGYHSNRFGERRETHYW
jgi:hypothetical protein